MNKIVIVGHPASGYGEVQSLLCQYGMAAALPSRREGLSPQDITAILCKAHKSPPLDNVVDEEDYAQIEAAPVWHGMALDLMLGNLEQPLWGWADPQAICTLDYWGGMDPQLTFMLVYDEPHSLLMDAARRQSSKGEAALSEQDLRRLLDNWIAYNRALLRFHLRHAGRSLLVHAKQVHRATDRYVEQLQPLLGMPLALSSDMKALPDSSGEERVPFTRLPMKQELSLALSAAGVEPREADLLLQAGPTERYLIDDLLSERHTVMQLYAELQSVANLPLDVSSGEAQGAAVAAWEALLRQRNFVTQLMVHLHGEVRRASDEVTQHQLALQDREAANAKALTQLQEQARHSHEQAKQFQGQATIQAEKLCSIGEENELLLTRLHQVQEELERYHLRLAGMERDKESAAKALQSEKEASAGALAQLQQQIALQAEKLRKETLDEANREANALRFQLGLVQSELAHVKRAPNLSLVPTRTLISTLGKRLIWRAMPASVMHSRAHQRAEVAKLELQRELEEIRQSQWFDAQWYLAMYQDVEQAGEDAAEHYHNHGWREGRKPSPGFDPTYYLTAYPDVRQAVIDPLLHFIRNGASEGRMPAEVLTNEA